ncbi:MAG TPA: ATP-binding protein, partial [Candidatus Angelobacter sp.]|nr:ATP-binding protein [Candidatus Angelobacter sp.]
IWHMIGPQIEAVMTRGESWWFEDQLVPFYRNGKLEDIYWTYSYSPVREPDGTICGTLVTCSETTGRVLAERALRTEQERLFNLFQQAPAFMAVLRGPEHIFQMANPPYLNLVGGRSVIGKSVAEAVPESIEQGYITILDRVYRTGEPFVAEGALFTMVRRSGEAPENRYLDFSYQPLRNADGSIDGIIVLGIDVTHRKEADEVLRKSEERLRLAQSAGQFTTWDWDLTTGEIAWNANVAEVFGRPGHELSSFDAFMRHVPESGREELTAKLNHALERGHEFSHEFRVVWPDKSLHWIAANGKPYYATGPRAVRMVGVSWNITARKRADEALVQAEKLAAVGQLASSIAHEINNPLEAVTNLLYLSAQAAILPEVQQYIALAQQELNRVTNITTQTLRFHRQSTRASTTSLRDVMENVLTLFQGRIINTGITVERRYKTEGKVFAYEGDLRQVIANLVSNAIDASQSGGKITVCVKDASDVKTGKRLVRITIADTGCGMAIETQQRMFDPFFTTKSATGTGLGLWVSSEILKNHHARIRVRSSQDHEHHGTVIALTFPEHF